MGEDKILHPDTIPVGDGALPVPPESAVFPARALDLSGRCCGRKPLVYKRPSLRYFCPRCDGEFGPDGKQRQNWAWKYFGDGFEATYPKQEAAQLVAKLFALKAEYPEPADGATTTRQLGASEAKHRDAQ